MFTRALTYTPSPASSHTYIHIHITRTSPPLARSNATPHHQHQHRLDTGSSHASNPDDEFGFDEVKIPAITDELPTDAGHKQYIKSLKRRVNQVETEHHLNQFEKHIDELVVVINNIPLKKVESEMRRIQETREAADDADKRLYLRRLGKIRQLKDLMLLRIERDHQKRLNRLRSRKVKAKDAEVRIAREQRQAMARAAKQLNRVLEDEIKVIEKGFGLLVEEENEAKDQMDWDKAFRKVVIQVDYLRAIKNKLPAGKYIMMVTLYDRLGGHPLRWSKQSEEFTYFGSTDVTAHGGKFYSIDVQFDDSEAHKVWLNCPPKHRSSPSMVFIFELFKTRGVRNKTEKVVAWGAFPMMSSSLSDTIKGKFKVPLLRGEMDVTIDKYSKIEGRISENIDAWLCNCYFTINHRARQMNGLDELKEKLKVTDKLLKLARRPQITPEEEGKAADLEYKNFGGEGGEEDVFKLSDYGFGADADLANEDEEDQFDHLDTDENRKNHIAAVEKANVLRQYKFSVTEVESDIPSDLQSEKIHYIFGELFQDTGYARWKTMEAWSTVFMFFIACWVRMLLHFTGQYFLLNDLGVQFWEFTMYGTYCELRYPTDTLEIYNEAFIVVFGVVSNIFIFAFKIAIVQLIQSTTNIFPDTASRYMLMYGVATTFDPILILFIDVCRSNWNGDSFKLYNMYLEREGSGVAGALLTVILSIILMACSTVLLYYYILHLHMNGRMLDIYHRLHNDESHFFVPNDMEISVRTLRWIINKSRDWQGFHGTRRKISVTKYVVQDHLDPDHQEETLHLSLYNVTKAQPNRPEERTLFRHFIRRNCGAICEIFAAEESMGATAYVEMEERLLTKGLSIGDVEAKELAQLQDMLQQRDQEAQDMEKNALRKFQQGSFARKRNGKGFEGFDDSDGRPRAFRRGETGTRLNMLDEELSEVSSEKVVELFSRSTNSRGEGEENVFD